MKPLNLVLPFVVGAMALASGWIAFSMLAEEGDATAVPGGQQAASHDFAMVQEGPAVELLENRVDLGELQPLSKRKHAFRLKNVGNQALEIKYPETCCGSKKNETLQPGEASVVELELQATWLPGPIAKTVRLTTNDPRTPEVLLSLTGVVVIYLAIEPKCIDFGQVTLGDTACKTLRIWCPAGHPIRDLDLGSPPAPYIAKETSSSSKSSPNERSIEIMAVPERIAGMGTAYLTVHGEVNGKEVNLEVPLRMRVVGQLWLEPFKISLKPEQNAKERTVRLFNRGKNPIRVHGVRTNSSMVVGRATPVREGYEYEIQLEPVQNAKPDLTVWGSFSVCTDHATIPEVSGTFAYSPR